MSKEEPAFPVSTNRTTNAYDGLTKREWFAGMALQVLTRNMEVEIFVRLKPQELAKASFLISDAMIEASKK